MPEVLVNGLLYVLCIDLAVRSACH